MPSYSFLEYIFGKRILWRFISNTRHPPLCTFTMYILASGHSLEAGSFVVCLFFTFFTAKPPKQSGLLFVRKHLINIQRAAASIRQEQQGDKEQPSIISQLLIIHVSFTRKCFLPVLSVWLLHHRNISTFCNQRHTNIQQSVLSIHQIVELETNIRKD